MAKERDNTWLQLQICPDIWRQKEDKGPLLECPEKAECRLIYAHPNKHVLDQSLASGYVVSCQAFVFSTYGANDGTMSRPPCTRVKCKYYHPPKALGLVVSNFNCHLSFHLCAMRIQIIVFIFALEKFLVKHFFKILVKNFCPSWPGEKSEIRLQASNSFIVDSFMRIQINTIIWMRINENLNDN